MPRKDRLNINLPTELIEQAKARADELGPSLSVVIERLLSNWLVAGGEMPPKPAEAKGGPSSKKKPR